MAYFLKNQNEDQNQQSGNQNQMSGGNIYSTSGSEVSSSTPTSTSSNSSSNSSQSNESGNWVNLNKYLDANQGKVGGYVDNLVNPYTSKESSYREGLNAGNQAYNTAITSDRAYKTDSKQSGAIAKNYMKDSKSVSDDDMDTFYKTTQGYAGPGEYQYTGDTYGYTTSRNQADEYSNVGANLGDANFQQSLMGNNVSTGGKKLNSFLIGGTQAGRDSVTNYMNKFSDLAALLDSQTSDLNNQRAGVVNVANQNAELAKQAVEDEAKKAKEVLTTSKNRALTDDDKTINVGVNKSYYKESPNMKIGDDWWQNNMSGTSIQVNPQSLNSGKVESKASQELQEIEQRKNDLLNNTRTADSSLDTNLNVIDKELHNRKIDEVNTVLTNAYPYFLWATALMGIHGIDSVKNAFSRLLSTNSAIRQGITDLYHGRINREQLTNIIKKNITRKNLGLKN